MAGSDEMNRNAQPLILAYREACRIELEAVKPGNVSLRSPGHDMSAADFSASAEASATWLAADLRLGERVFRAVEATRAAVNCNTNLGIVLLCAPLMQAMDIGPAALNLRARARKVLHDADEIDTEWVYRAIRLAAPGGLGKTVRYDIAETPRASLKTVMWEAAHRDRIALQYVNGFSEIFDYALPRLREYLGRWQDEAWAAAAVFLGLLRRFPDSHVERKHGTGVAREISARAARLEAELLQSDAPADCLPALREVDEEFKRAGVNPGTTADLTVACLLARRLEKRLDTEAKGVPLVTSEPSHPRGHSIRGPSLVISTQRGVPQWL